MKSNILEFINANYQYISFICNLIEMIENLLCVDPLSQSNRELHIISIIIYQSFSYINSTDIRGHKKSLYEIS